MLKIKRKRIYKRKKNLIKGEKESEKMRKLNNS